MSQDERFGRRDLSYSAWHRVRSIARYVGLESAQSLKMIDQDVTLFVELDGSTREPLALVEVAIDVGQHRKSASTTARLASRCNLPAYVVLYRLAKQPNPADPREFDIDGFRVRRIWPMPENEWRTLTPAEWANGLRHIRAWSVQRLDLAANDGEWESGPEQGRLFEERQA